MYKVTFTWDGKKPPATFYNRLHRFGLRMISAKEVENAKKTPPNRWSGVAWWTRGSVTCESEALAHEVSGLAKYYGAQVEHQTV